MIFLLIAGIAVLGLTGVIDLSYPRVISPTPPAEITPADLSPSPTPNPEIEGWETFSSEEIGFSIEYPSDINISRMEDTVVMTKQGPTQRQNTEFYDGISLSFSSGPLGERSLREFAEEEAIGYRQQPVVDEVSNLRFVTINDISGYSFDVVSLGERTYIYLPQGEDRYLQIINATVDPANQGFSETVNLMFSTLRIKT